MKHHLPDTLRPVKRPGARALDDNERAHQCCLHAKKYISAGDYESAQAALSPYWEDIGQAPRLEGLDESASAELLLCAGVTAGWIGGARQVEGAQAFAKDLLSRSLELYENLGSAGKVAEAQVELAYCYWREGAGEEARILYQEAINRLTAEDGDLKAIALIRMAAAERTSMRSIESMNSLTAARPFAEASADQGLKGRFHLEFANLLQSLGAAENRSDYMDRALIEYAAASYHFEQAGHARYWAHVENNLGYLFHKLGKFDDAHLHLDRALLLFTKLNDAVFAAQVKETRARTLLAQGRTADAEATARAAVRSLEKSGEQALLAEALVTRAAALAKLDKHPLALSTFERAIDTAAIAGSAELAGLAALELIEELGQHLSAQKISAYYAQADQLLEHSQDHATLTRLRRAARLALASGITPDPPAEIIDQLQGGPETDKRSSVANLIEQALGRYGKQVNFTPQAIETIARLFLTDSLQELRSVIDGTVAAADDGAVIFENAVEVVALRGAAGANFARPWDGFSLREKNKSAEARFIALALHDAAGKISVAAKLLGFPHYELLNSIIKSRHPELLSARSPIVPRKRSIIKKSVR